MKTYPMVEVSQANDIVIYNDSNNNPMHIGRGLKDGYVISKWGPSHVYRHPLLYVPSVYGNPLIYRHPSLIQA